MSKFITGIISNRNIQFDLIKGIAIVAIIFWHFEIIPNYYLLWAIPSFLVVTAALYKDKWLNIKPSKIIKNFIWIFGVIISFTVLAYYLKIPELNHEIHPDLEFNLTYFIFRNHYLGELWYFILYFQLLFAFYFSAKIFSKIKIKLDKWYVGLIILLTSLGFSYALLFTVGRGVSLNIFSWSLLIWLALFHFPKINKIASLKTAFISLIICVAFFLIGGQKLINFLLDHTHDFIWPTIIFQLASLFVLIYISKFLSKFKKASLPLVILGQYSLYIYIFHQFFYKALFPQLHVVWGIILSIILSIITGIILEKIRKIIF